MYFFIASSRLIPPATSDDHHREIQPVIISHHTAIEHAEDRRVGRDGQGQLAAGTGDHQSLHRIIIPDDLNVFGDLHFLSLLSADSVKLRSVLLGNADDCQNSQDYGHSNTAPIPLSGRGSGASGHDTFY